MHRWGIMRRSILCFYDLIILEFLFLFLFAGNKFFALVLDAKKTDQKEFE